MSIGVSNLPHQRRRDPPIPGSAVAGALRPAPCTHRRGRGAVGRSIMSASDSSVAVGPARPPGAPPRGVAQAPPGTDGARRGRRRLSRREKRNLTTGLLFISPWVIGVIVFVIYPLVYSFAISLTQYSGMQTPTFIGLQNYVAAFLDPLVRTSVGNTVYYLLIA